MQYEKVLIGMAEVGIGLAGFVAILIAISTRERPFDPFATNFAHLIIVNSRSGRAWARHSVDGVGIRCRCSVGFHIKHAGVSVSNVVFRVLRRPVQLGCDYRR